jgi:hypothetical protein
MYKFLLLYIALTLATRWPSLPHLLDRFLGGSSYDAGLYIYLAKNAWPSFFSQAWFDTNAFYPYGYSLAWSDNFILISIIFKFLAYFMPAALAYNLILLTAQVLNGWTVHLLARRLNFNSELSFLAGSVMCCFAYFCSQLGHPQVQFFFFIPCAVHILINYLTSKKKLFGFLLGLTIAASFLVTVYYTIFAVALLIIIIAFQLLNGVLKENLKLIGQLGLINIPLLIACLPILYPYYQVKKAFGSRFLYEAEAFAISPTSFFNPSSLSLFYNSIALNDGDSQFFPGFLILFLAAFIFIKFPLKSGYKLVLLAASSLFVVTHNFKELAPALLIITSRWALLLTSAFVLSKFFALRNRTEQVLISSLVFVALIFLILATGPASLNSNLWLDPFYLLFNILPGMDAVRAVSRCLLVSYFCFLLVLVWGLSLSTVINKKLLTIFVLLITLEQIPWTLAIEHEPERPAILSSLPAANSNEVQALVVLPMATEFDQLNQPKSWSEYSRLNVNVMNWLGNSDYKLLNGYSGQRSRIIKDFPHKLKNFPDARSVAALKHIAGLKYILVLSHEIPNFDQQEFHRQLKNYPSDLRLIASVNQNYLIEISEKTNLSKDFYLLAPNQKDLFLRIKLRSHCEPNLAQPKLTIINNTSGVSTPLALYPQQDRKELSFALNLAPTLETNRLHPNRFSFELPSGCIANLELAKVDHKPEYLNRFEDKSNLLTVLN